MGSTDPGPIFDSSGTVDSVVCERRRWVLLVMWYRQYQAANFGDRTRFNRTCRRCSNRWIIVFCRERSLLTLCVWHSFVHQGRDTKPELLIRRALHAKGLRYRLHARRLPGKPDLVFPIYNAAIFVHGCFWHGHACCLFKSPKTRQSFWKSKITLNQSRNHVAEQRPREIGWRTLVIWECSLRGTDRIDFRELIDRCVDFLMCSDN